MQSWAPGILLHAGGNASMLTHSCEAQSVSCVTDSHSQSAPLVANPLFGGEVIQVLEVMGQVLT